MRDVRVIRVAPKRIDLVLHQGDERADHDGRPFLDQGGQLITQGLATSGRHDDEDILAGHEAFDHLFLRALELVETKKTLQSLLNGGPDQR